MCPVELNKKKFYNLGARWVQIVWYSIDHNIYLEKYQNTTIKEKIPACKEFKTRESKCYAISVPPDGVWVLHLQHFIAVITDQQI